MSPIKFMSTSCEFALRWMPQNTFDHKSTLTQIMVWCWHLLEPMLTKVSVAIWCHKATHIELTHWGWVMHICVSELWHRCFQVMTFIIIIHQSYYLKHCWDIVDWTLGNKLQWNFDWNSYILRQENLSENVVWKMAAILSGPQCVNALRPGDAYISELSHHWFR